MNLTVESRQLPNVLLIGNGINRAFNFLSWGDLLKDIALPEKRELKLDNVPAPLQAVILTNDTVDSRLKEVSQKLVDMKSSSDEERLLSKTVELPFDAILTANYTYELEKAICHDFKLTSGRASKYRKVSNDEKNEFLRNNLYTYFELPNCSKPIWHIHGEAGKVKTMILGHYYYGKMLSSMHSYLPMLISRYKSAQSKQITFEYRSWVDYFLIGNVTIIGLGLDLSELDLWWLINAKKRRFPDTKITFYKPDITSEEELLAEAYSVTVVKDGFDGDYKKYYEKLIRKLERGEK